MTKTPKQQAQKMAESIAEGVRIYVAGYTNKLVLKDFAANIAPIIAKELNLEQLIEDKMRLERIAYLAYHKLGGSSLTAELNEELNQSLIFEKRKQDLLLHPISTAMKDGE